MDPGCSQPHNQSDPREEKEENPRRAHDDMSNPWNLQESIALREAVQGYPRDCLSLVSVFVWFPLQRQWAPFSACSATVAVAPRSN